MHLAQATTLNWGGLPNRDYALGTHTLLAGETGSGKTSLIDAVVAVMGGGGQLKSKFNTAQSQAGQSSKKSQRTLASYVAGSDGMGRFLRPAGAHGYVCVAWRKDPNDGDHGEPFTAIVGVEAAVDREASPASDIVRILVRGHVVGVADLTSGPETVLRAQELLVALRLKYGQSVRDFRTGSEYLSMLYAYLKGDTTPVSREEADSAVKAFVSAIAYRQPHDIDGLIREEILESVNNEGLIQRLIETIREVNRLKFEAARMEGNIQKLEETDEELRKAFEAFMDERMFRALIDIRKASDVQEACAHKAAERQTQNAALERVRQDIERCNADQERKRKQHQDLVVLMRDNDNYTRKLDLERMIDEQQRIMDAILLRVSETTSGFHKAFQDIALVERAVDSVPGLEARKPAVEALRAEFAAVSLPLLERTLKALEEELDDGALVVADGIISAMVACLSVSWENALNAEDGLRAAFNHAYRNVEREREETEKEAHDVSRRAERLRAGQVEYPPAVELFLDRLKRSLPQAKPRVLCDVVDMARPEWQAALEGYIGRDRFTVLYDRTFETDVVSHAKALRREISGRSGDISVPQLSLAIGDNPKVESDSIVHLLKIDRDPEATGYLKARYGRTITVRDTGTLRTTRSGVMQDGWSTQGYRYQQRRCPDDELVFGAEIRRKQRETLLKRVTELETRRDRLLAQRKMLADALRIQTPATPMLNGGDPTRFYEAAALRHMARDDLAKLDLSSFAKLEAQANTLQEEIAHIIKSANGLHSTKGKHEATIEALDLQIVAHRKELETLEPVARNAREAHQRLMEAAFVDRERWPERLEEEMAERRPVASYDRRSNERANTVTNGVNDVNNRIAAYNRDALEFQRIDVPPFSYVPRFSAEVVVDWMHDVWHRLREQIRSQKETGLPERRAQCEMAERSFTSSFTTDFCSTVLSNVEGRADTISVLNSNLERINFGGDTFKLVHFLRPEYEDYIRLFRKIRELTETRKANLDLFGAQELAPEDHETLVRIRDLLLDEQDSERSLLELRRIADYRNYRTYDFQRGRGDATVLLSTWGTGSGGESDTPVYVIRAAVMASAFRLFSQQRKAHFRSIFLDEVFATMDEIRTRRVLRFLKELGLQIVCAAPTRSMAAVLDEFDVRINFSRYVTPAGDRSDVNVVNLDRARVHELFDAHRKATADRAKASFEEGETPELSVVEGDRGRLIQSGGGS